MSDTPVDAVSKRTKSTEGNKRDFSIRIKINLQLNYLRLKTPTTRDAVCQIMEKSGGGSVLGTPENTDQELIRFCALT